MVDAWSYCHDAKPNLSILHHFAPVQDPRRASHVTYPLPDILFIALCAVMAGAKDCQDIELFGRSRLHWLRTFLELPHGIPSHDTFARVLQTLKPSAFQTCLRNWIASWTQDLNMGHIAIDGKTLRGSRSPKLGPLHIVSAWATQHRLTLGQIAVEDKSNEITAIPKLLQLLELGGALVSIDAMGCQKAIAAQIVDQGGDYVLVVKGNQANLLEDIQTALIAAEDKDFVGMDYDQYETSERGHGREEYRSYLVLHCTEGIRNAEHWKKLTTIGQCYSRRQIGDQIQEEVRYFIGSRRCSARYYGHGLRGHWGIENHLHWQLDVTFGEDSHRVADRHGAANFALLRRVAVTLLQAHPSSMSLPKKRYAATMNTEFLEEALDAGRNLGNL